MNKKTIDDIQELKKLDQQRYDLLLKIHKIKEDCQCLDPELKLVKTLQFQFTPKFVCPVCDKISKKELTLDEKIKCFKDFFEKDDYNTYTEEDYKKMALAGGLNI